MKNIDIRQNSSQLYKTGNRAKPESIQRPKEIQFSTFRESTLRFPTNFFYSTARVFSENRVSLHQKLKPTVTYKPVYCINVPTCNSFSYKSSIILQNDLTKPKYLSRTMLKDSTELNVKNYPRIGSKQLKIKGRTVRKSSGSKVKAKLSLVRGSSVLMSEKPKSSFLKPDYKPNLITKNVSATCNILKIDRQCGSVSGWDYEEI